MINPVFKYGVEKRYETWIDKLSGQTRHIDDDTS